MRVERVPRLLEDEARYVWLLSWMWNMASRILQDREDAMATLAESLRRLVAAARERRVRSDELRWAAISLLLSTIYAHGVPVMNWEVAEALGFESPRELEREAVRGRRVLSRLGVQPPRSTPESRILRTVSIARRLASELKLPEHTVNLAGDIAASILNIVDRNHWRESLSKVAVYLAVKATRAPVSTAELAKTFKTRENMLFKIMRRLSITIVYPPANNGEAKKSQRWSQPATANTNPANGGEAKVEVEVGRDRLRVYCASCGAPIKVRTETHSRYISLYPPKKCPVCRAKLDHSKPTIILARKTGNPVKLTVTAGGPTARVLAA